MILGRIGPSGKAVIGAQNTNSERKCDLRGLDPSTHTLATGAYYVMPQKSKGPPYLICVARLSRKLGITLAIRETRGDVH